MEKKLFRAEVTKKEQQEGCRYLDAQIGNDIC